MFIGRCWNVPEQRISSLILTFYRKLHKRWFNQYRRIQTVKYGHDRTIASLRDVWKWTFSFCISILLWHITPLFQSLIAHVPALQDQLQANATTQSILEKNGEGLLGSLLIEILLVYILCLIFYTCDTVMNGWSNMWNVSSRHVL